MWDFLEDYISPWVIFVLCICAIILILIIYVICIFKLVIL